MATKLDVVLAPQSRVVVGVRLPSSVCLVLLWVPQPRTPIALALGLLATILALIAPHSEIAVNANNSKVTALGARVLVVSLILAKLQELLVALLPPFAPAISTVIAPLV